MSEKQRCELCEIVANTTLKNGRWLCYGCIVDIDEDSRRQDKTPPTRVIREDSYASLLAVARAAKKLTDNTAQNGMTTTGALLLSKLDDLLLQLPDHIKAEIEK